MANIYVLLIRSNTMFSRMIHMVTGAQYTHAAISLDPNCSRVYSFSRKYTYIPLPAGFVSESVHRGLMHKCRNAPFALYRAQISEEQYRRLEQRFERMLAVGKFHYSLTGPFLCFFGIQRKKSYHYFCSQFVAEILQELGVISAKKPASLYQPVDFAFLSELELCCKGNLGELQNRRESRKRLSVSM
ncbi:MAG: hypothetical protein Q4C48_03885 [Lachnospiraceae bacterium]|nr:hypothetical protein [Lachnospiraceae bacterium]